MLSKGNCFNLGYNHTPFSIHRDLVSMFSSHQMKINGFELASQMTI